MYTFVMIRIIIRLLYSNADEVFICRKYKTTPCDTANALVGTIFYRNVINSAINGSGGDIGVI